VRQPEVVAELVGMVWRTGRTGIDAGFRNVVRDCGQASSVLRQAGVVTVDLGLG